MQLWPLFCRRIVATCSAWYARSASLHSARHDDDRRDSAELGRDGLVQQRPPFAAPPRGLRPRPARADGPHTMVSNVAAAPVMWTCAMSGCCVRYAPTSGPPVTIRTQAQFDERCECALEDRHEGILRRIDLQDRDAVVREQLVEHVEHGDRGDDCRRPGRGRCRPSRPARAGRDLRRGRRPPARRRAAARPRRSSPTGAARRCGSSGKACTRTRPPGAASVFTPSSGLPPFDELRERAVVAHRAR